MAESKKQIVIICSSIGGGGAEKVAVNIATELHKLSYKVTIFFWQRKPGLEYELPSEIELIESEGSVWSRIYKLSRLLSDRSFYAGISFADMSNIIFWLARFLSSSDAVSLSTVHNDLVARDLGSGRISLKRKVIRRLHSLACRSSNKVVAVSIGVARSARTYLKLNQSQIVAIYNPVLSKLPDANAIRKIDYPCRLMAAGRLCEQKDYPSLLLAIEDLVFNRNIQCTLDIFGDGPLKAELEQLSEELGLTKYVAFKGFSKELEKEFFCHDIFILSSRWEGFGNVLVEALASNISIVAANCESGPAEILKDGHFGRLVEIGNPRAIAQAVESFLKDGPLPISQIDLDLHLTQFTNRSATCRYLDIIESASHET